VSGTNHLSFGRGATFSFTRRALDENNRPIDLTGAKIYLIMRPDMKATDPAAKLTSDSPPPSGWRVGIVISDQVQFKGDYVVTFIPADTASFVALGHDDPWLYNVRIKLADTSVLEDVETSNIDLNPEVGDIP
jgi:hypothetical protein